MYVIWGSVPIWFVVALALLCLSFRQFDKILKTIYAASPETWRQLGRPMGFFWLPKDVSSLSLASSIARARVYRCLMSRSKLDVDLCADLTGDVNVMRAFSFYSQASFVIMFVEVLFCAALTLLLRQ